MDKSYFLSSLRKSCCEWHDLPSSPQPPGNTLTFGSLTVPSAVNRNTGRTYMSWEGFLGKPNWIWVWNQTFLQTSGSTLAAAKTKVNGKSKTLPFLCLQNHSPRCHRTMTATHGMEQPENSCLSVTWNNLFSCWLQPQRRSGMAQKAHEIWTDFKKEISIYKIGLIITNKMNYRSVGGETFTFRPPWLILRVDCFLQAGRKWSDIYRLPLQPVFLQRPWVIPPLAVSQVPKDLDPKATKAMVYAKNLTIVGLKYLRA